MSSYNPPIENLPIFDTILFREANGDTLTRSEADRRYLRFPFAQGTENLQAVNVSGNAVFNGDLTLNQTKIHLGTNAGVSQGTNTVAIGYLTAQTTQGNNATAVGHNAGNNNQGAGAVAIGHNAGEGLTTGQGAQAIAIGLNSGRTSQTTEAIAIGTEAGRYSQASKAIAIGFNAGQGSTTAGQNQKADTVAIGGSAGQINQQQFSVAIGANAGQNNQNQYSVAIGTSAGQYSQGSETVVIGSFAAAGVSPTTSGCGNRSICIGRLAKGSSSSTESIAIGNEANTATHTQSVALGNLALCTANNQIRLGTASENVSIPGTLTSAGLTTTAGLTVTGANNFIIPNNGTASVYCGTPMAGANVRFFGTSAVGFEGGYFDYYPNFRFRSVNSTGGIAVPDAVVLDAAGILNVNAGLTMGSNKNITLGNGSTAPTTGQLGATISTAISAATFSTAAANIKNITINQGVWLINTQVEISYGTSTTIGDITMNWSLSSANVITPIEGTKTTIDLPISTASGIIKSHTFSFVYYNSTANKTLYLNALYRAQTTAPAITASSSYVIYTRIA